MPDHFECVGPSQLLVHNFVLTIFPMVMLVGTVRLVVLHYLEHGFFAVWMDPEVCGAYVVRL